MLVKNNNNKHTYIQQKHITAEFFSPSSVPSVFLIYCKSVSLSFGGAPGTICP